MTSAEYQHDWYLRHRDELLARSTAYQKTHKAQRKARYRRNPVSGLLRSAKSRAKRTHVPFNLCLTDIQIPDVCPILGIKLAVSLSGRHTGSSPSIDRIIPALGYVRGNVIVTSWRANRIKSDATVQELTAIAEFYRNLQVQKG